MTARALSFALVTPARNEASFIEQTLKSVIGQTIHPVRWVIVSDGSSDGTDDLVRRHIPENPWIELVQLPHRPERHFGGKVKAFNAGYERLKSLSWDIIGSMDGDISVDDPTIFAFLLGKFSENLKLGIAGVPFREDNTTYDYRFSSTDHVSGACQLFRRECYEGIGGYTPLPGGGIDVVAVLSARHAGWQTQTFPEKFCCHHRKMGSALHGKLMVRFKDGQKDYLLGGHPLWEGFRCLYQMFRRPYLIGGSLMLWGYLWALVCRKPRTIPPELMAFRRGEQLARLKRFLLRQ